MKQSNTVSKISVLPVEQLKNDETVTIASNDASSESPGAVGMRRSRRNRLTARNMISMVPGRGSNASTVANSTDVVLSTTTNFRLVAQKDLRRMTQQLFAYRSSIPDGPDKQEFDGKN